MSEIITANKLSRYFGIKQNPIKALDSVDLKVKKGSFTVIIGRSGSGKSTFLNLLAGLDKPTAGELVVNGKELSKFSKNKLANYRSEIGVIFQFYNLFPNLNTLENVMMGAWAGGDSVTKEKAINLLTRFGLDHRINADVKTLSGGEKQRVAICRSLIGDPKILFCDEPTGALDTKNEDQVMDILLGLNKKDGVTIVMVTHNPVFKKIADQVIEMEDGKIVKKK